MNTTFTVKVSKLVLDGEVYVSNKTFHEVEEFFELYLKYQEENE